MQTPQRSLCAMHSKGLKTFQPEEVMKLRLVSTKLSMVTAACLALASLFALPARSQGAGEALYKAKCAACHGPDGKGETAIGKANKLREFLVLRMSKNRATKNSQV